MSQEQRDQVRDETLQIEDSGGVVQFYREREQVLQREDRFKMLTQ